MRSLALVAAAFSIVLGAGAPARPDADADEEWEVIDLSPEDKVGWSMRNVFAPLTGLFLGGPGYWYEDREIEVRTTPPGGLVDLFYVRASFQKRFEQAETPVKVILPPRIETGPRDVLNVRAFREGYREQLVTLRMSSRQDRIVIDLEPLPNTLEALSHRYFAGRASIGFLTDELLEFRIQEVEDGFTVILNETALSPDAVSSVESVKSPLVADLFTQQLGEDLVIQISLADPARGNVELRSRQTRIAARDLYEFSVDLVPPDGGGEAVQRALDALRRIETRHVTGCALAFDADLRQRLDAGSLARALSPQGSFIDKYVRAGMRRLGDLTPGGVVDFGDGGRFDPTQLIELEAALSRAGEATGILALLRQFVAELEPEQYRLDTLRSLIAHELDATRFQEIIAASEQVERECLASR